MKIVMLNDSRTFYMHTAEPYVGTVQKENAESVLSYYIRKLSEPLHGSGRNITCDNWISSVEIFDKMLSEYSMTMVRKNQILYYFTMIQKEALIVSTTCDMNIPQQAMCSVSSSCGQKNKNCM